MSNELPSILLYSGTNSSCRGEAEVGILDKVNSLNLTYNSLCMYFGIINSSWSFYISRIIFLVYFTNQILFELRLNN